MQFKFAVVIVCLFFIGVLTNSSKEISSAELEKIEKLFKKCIDVTGADPALVKAALAGDNVQDHKVKCVSACLLREEGVLKNGEVDKEKMIETVPTDIPEERQEFMKESIDQCAAERGTDECDTAHRIFTCINSKMESKQSSTSA